MKHLSHFLIAISSVTLLATQQTIAAENSSAPIYQIELKAATQLNRQASELNQAVIDYCQDDQKTGLAPLKQQWLDTAQAWMALQGQAKGPEQAISLGWSMQFWPDKKDITGRKMAQIIQQPELWEPQTIAEQSVTVQSLGGLEWLLYDEKSSFAQGDKNACSLAKAISQNFNHNTQKIVTAWQKNPWQGYSAAQWQSEYFGLLNNQMDYTLHKLQRPMGKIGHPKPYFAESWRSQTSLVHIKSNLVAMKALYQADGEHGLDALLRAKGESELADRIVLHFEQAIATLPTSPSLFTQLQTKEGYKNMIAQYNKLEYVQYLLQQEAAVALGIVVGFNSTDGD
ncbi:imelysin family protein [Vibrio gangliei]|uniref:imelysin family protein n=1 Tax=Vibrio gangliei TaxID=2077090 RepID=UPI000D018450|nr:imelysin family protein [Vibrio gangliei]